MEGPRVTDPVECHHGSRLSISDLTCLRDTKPILFKPLLQCKLIAVPHTPTKRGLSDIMSAPWRHHLEGRGCALTYFVSIPQKLRVVWDTEGSCWGPLSGRLTQRAGV